MRSRRRCVGLHRLASLTEAHAVDVYSSWRDDDLDEAEFVGILAAYVAAANQRAAALADLSLATTVTAALQRPVAPLGLLPPSGDADWLHTAGLTLLSTPGRDP